MSRFGAIAGPGDYDPSKAKGFKADPKSGFLTGDRFGDLEREGTFLCLLCIVPTCLTSDQAGRC